MEGPFGALNGVDLITRIIMIGLSVDNKFTILHRLASLNHFMYQIKMVYMAKVDIGPIKTQCKVGLKRCTEEENKNGRKSNAGFIDLRAK